MKNKIVIVIILLLFTTTDAYSARVNFTFPLDNYNQNIDFWFNKKNENYNKIQIPINVEKKYFEEFKSGYFGEKSPWSQKGVTNILNDLSDKTRVHWDQFNEVLATYKVNILNPEENNSTLYGRNLRRLNIAWFNKLYSNINFEELRSTTFNSAQRAIAVKNIMLLSVPSDEAIFNNPINAGSGYPFNLANYSSANAGTPLYIVSTTKDKAWYFVITPVLNGWVKAEDIAFVSDHFINTWSKYAYKALAGIITSNLPVISNNKNFMFSALVGTVLPVYKQNTKAFTILVPTKNITGYAEIHYVNVSKNDATLIPIPVTMKNFSTIIRTLIGRSYGWGGMDFYNDCSQEIISVYNIFGILLPRNSYQMADKFAANNTDISSLSVENRSKAILENAIPFASFIYVPGHIMIYVGSYNTKYGKNTIMIYHDAWGLKPKSGPDVRYIIGQSTIFPIINNYEEVPLARSLIDKDTVVIVNLVPKTNNLK